MKRMKLLLSLVCAGVLLLSGLPLPAAHSEEPPAWLGELPEGGWQAELDALLTGGEVCLLLGKADGMPALAVRINGQDGTLQAGVDAWRSGRWKSLFTSAGTAAYDPALPLHCTIYRYDSSEEIGIRLSQDGSELLTCTARELTIRVMLSLRRVSISADGAAEYGNFALMKAEKEKNEMEKILEGIKPEEKGYYLAIARQAVDDVIKNFWMGDTQTGKIRPTWAGFSEHLDDWRGSTWETAMLVFGICDMWRITGEEYYHDLLKAEAKFFRENFREDELENAGGLFMWANDDTGWNAMLLLCLYSATGDTWFVDRVIGLLDQANARWYDEKLGGLHYKDGVDYMALCEVGITWSWLRLWEITGEQRFYDLSFASYSRLHNRMGRDDGLYFMEANAFWPIGSKDLLQEAGSSTFLGGNMCMAALSVKFYRATGKEEYLDRAYHTVEGIVKNYDRKGILLNDRDAWCNSTFAAFFVSEVLSLPGTLEMQQLLKNTAISIVNNDRTGDGYYGGSWQGPAEGTGSIWHQAGSVARQSMTTGNTVLIVTAAALLEAGITGYER